MLEELLQHFAQEIATEVERDPYETSAMWEQRQQEAVRNTGGVAYLRYFGRDVGSDQITLELSDMETEYDPETEQFSIGRLTEFQVPDLIRLDLSPLYERRSGQDNAHFVSSMSNSPQFNTSYYGLHESRFAEEGTISSAFIYLPRDRARELDVARSKSILRLRLQILSLAPRSNQFPLLLIGVEWLVGTTVVGQWTIDRTATRPAPARTRRRSEESVPPLPPPPPPRLRIIPASPPPPPPPPPAGPLDFSEVSPEIIGGLEALQARVIYPDADKMAGNQGTVVVRFIVTPEGRAADVTVARSVSPSLDAAAVHVVSQARFTPGRQNGQAVAVRMSVPVRFTIR